MATRLLGVVVMGASIRCIAKQYIGLTSRISCDAGHGICDFLDLQAKPNFLGNRLLNGSTLSHRLQTWVVKPIRYAGLKGAHRELNATASLVETEI
jgi:hypothetical protein